MTAYRSMGVWGYRSVGKVKSPISKKKKDTSWNTQIAYIRTPEHQRIRMTQLQVNDEKMMKLEIAITKTQAKACGY